MIDVVCIASFNADLVSRVPRPPARGETLMARGFRVEPGGKGSNAAIACARQGARTAVVARIGQDDFGRMALSLWQRERIDAAAVEQTDGEPSGVAQIWVYDDGDNSIAIAPGAGAGLGPAQIGRAEGLIRSARVVMASCEVPLAATLAAFRIARSAGVTTLLNPAPAMALPDELLGLCDVITPNAHELREMAEPMIGWQAAADVSAAAAAMMDRGVARVAVTLGDQGSALLERAPPASTGPAGAPWLQRFAAHAVEVTDTIGAGDTFTGALAAALAAGRPWSEAMQRANAAAALSVTAAGAIAGMPDAQAVERLLNR